jgi:curved DNA-binding protein CbpA
MAMPNPSQPQLPDYYDVLGVDFNATADEVSKAFRQRARCVHPDRQADVNVNDWHLAQGLHYIDGQHQKARLQ